MDERNDEPSVAVLAEARRRRADQARQVGDVLRHQVLAGSVSGPGATQ